MSIISPIDLRIPHGPTLHIDQRNVIKLILAALTSIPALLAIVTGIVELDDDGLNLPITINQGDRVRVPGAATCTIGYVDAANRTAYTAGHCTKNDDDVAMSTTKIVFGDIDFDDADIAANRDIATITLSDNVRIGENPYSGDTVLTENEIRTLAQRDDIQVCNYGMRSKTVYCQNISHTDSTYIYGEGDPSKHGDSGGPAWFVNADGQSLGLVGVLSGTSAGHTLYTIIPDGFGEPR